MSPCCAAVPLGSWATEYYLIAVTPDNAPDFADDDPLLGPWLAHARATISDGNVILWRDAVDFTTGPEDAARSEVQAMVNMAGADHLSELDLGDEHEVECHRVDYGPAGLVGLRRIVIYGELGLSPPASAPQPAAAGGDPTRTAPPAPAARVRRLRRRAAPACGPAARLPGAVGQPRAGRRRAVPFARDLLPAAAHGGGAPGRLPRGQPVGVTSGSASPWRSRTGR
jgi:hypothetical protein